MPRSLEGYFLLNFAMDAALIAVVARANDCLHVKRVLLGALIAAVYALLVAVFTPALAHPAIQLLLLVPVALVVCENGEARRWGSIAFQLFCGTAMIGGIGMLFAHKGISPLWMAAVLCGGLLALHMLFSVRARRLISWEVNVCLSVCGRSIRFRALIDTGNRLREPISGLPVLIAESSLLQELLATEIANTGPFRQITFGGLGGSGTVQCFHPDHVWIRRGDQLIQAPEIWVAIYPGKIPGISRALAPPSFAVIPGKI